MTRNAHGLNVNHDVSDGEESEASQLKLFRNFHKKELLFKIIVIGDYGVGKTSIIRRYAKGTFSSNYKITIGADFALKSIEWDSQTRINLQLWDIAGHERFGELTGVYYRYAVAAAIVFDLTRPQTFQSVEKWLQDVRRKAKLPGGQRLPVIVLANKGDMTIAPLNDIEIQSFCAKHNIFAWFITSAKENVHIDEAMLTLISEAFHNHENLQFLSADADTDIVRLDEDTQNDKTLEKHQYCCQTFI